MTHVFVSVDEWFDYPDFNEYYGPSNVIHVIKFNNLLEKYVYMHIKRAPE